MGIGRSHELRGSYRAAVGISGLVLLTLLSPWARADELAQLVQNPIAKVISFPFQDNLTFGVGPQSDQQNVLNIQPVLPFDVGDDWNLITRTIVPIIHEPVRVPGGESSNGIGDTSVALYFSPAHPGSVIWGVGPAFTFATASHRELGQGKTDAGLSAVALTIRGHWLIGGLVTDVVSVAGASDRSDVHQMLLQPFVNYNFSRGWYLTTSPIITANWKAQSDQRWTVPIGGGGGRAFRVSKQAMNFQVQAFKLVERPHDAGDWVLRAQFQLLFPK